MFVLCVLASVGSRISNVEVVDFEDLREEALASREIAKRHRYFILKED